MGQLVKIIEPLAEVMVTFDNKKSMKDAAGDILTTPRRITGIGTTGNAINANRRIYPTPVLRDAVAEVTAKIASGHSLTGQIDHPEYDEDAELEDVVVNWTTIILNGNSVELAGLLSPIKGQRIEELLSIGMRVGISMRAWGVVEPIDMLGDVAYQVTELHIEGYDFVLNAADANGVVKTLESKKMTTATIPTNADDDVVSLQTKIPAIYDKVVAEYEAKQTEIRLAREAEQKIADAKAEAIQLEKLANQAKIDGIVAEREQQMRDTLGLSPDDDLLLVLSEQRKKAAEADKIKLADAVNKAIDTELNKTKFADVTMKGIRDSVIALAPNSAEQATQLTLNQIKMFEKVMVDIDKVTQGTAVKQQVLQVASVFEKETNQPEFMRPAVLLVERMQRTRIGKAWNMVKPQNPNEVFAAQYLDHALNNELIKRNLILESRQFNDTTTTADLNLPYSLMMGVIAQAVPSLVATGMFAADTMNAPIERRYYSRFVGDEGKTVTVSNEAVTITTLETPVKLAGAQITFGSVVVTKGATTFEEGDDFIIKYTEGTIMAVTGGGIVATDVLAVDYVYDAIRQGEGMGIQRAGLTQTPITMTASAVRLATLITDEAILFSQALNNDNILKRTLEALVLDIRNKIDGALFAEATSAALSVRNNNAGSWDSGVGDLAAFTNLVGTAKTMVGDRFYKPDFLLLSLANADHLSNSPSFTSAGSRVDGHLTPEGNVGRFKGLEVFQSPLVVDSYALIGNREVVLYSMFKPMQLKGGQMNRDNEGLLVDSQEWFVVEYNAIASPVPEKASYFKITA